jgi:acyl phosphate:glycerol-3-phosphate acyltransferase
MTGLSLALLLGYFLGAIPFGLLLTRAAGLGDIRAIGSGNIGATNVLRTGNKPLAAATLVCDVLKGTAAVVLGWYVAEMMAPGSTHTNAEAVFGGAHAGGLGAFLGHLYPIWLRFKGGKGVATYIGVLLGLAWPLALAFCAVWLAVAWLWRYSSLAALTAAVATPLTALATGQSQTGIVLIVLSLLLISKHQGNIGRLIGGREPKIGASK